MSQQHELVNVNALILNISHEVFLSLGNIVDLVLISDPHRSVLFLLFLSPHIGLVLAERNFLAVNVEYRSNGRLTLFHEVGMDFGIGLQIVVLVGEEPVPGICQCGLTGAVLATKRGDAGEVVLSMCDSLKRVKNQFL